MPITILVAVSILMAVMVIFGFTYKMKGVKTAIIATGAALSSDQANWQSS